MLKSNSLEVNKERVCQIMALINKKMSAFPTGIKA